MAMASSDPHEIDFILVEGVLPCPPDHLLGMRVDETVVRARGCFARERSKQGH